MEKNGKEIRTNNFGCHLQKYQEKQSIKSQFGPSWGEITGKKNQISDNFGCDLQNNLKSNYINDRFGRYVQKQRGKSEINDNFDPHMQN